MGIERVGELQAKLFDQRAVAPRLLEYRIDQHRFMRGRVPQQIGVGGGGGVEHLAEDQHGLS